MKAETEAQREKHRKEREWADFLAKIDKQADSPVFQVIFGEFKQVEQAQQNKGRNDDLGVVTDGRFC